MHKILWGGLVLLLGITSGCADNPLAPTAEPAADAATFTEWSSVQGCVITGTCPIGPWVVVGTPECDPWLDPDWCQGGEFECMESVGIPGSPELIGLASCPPGGSPISPVGPCPTWDPTCPRTGGPGGTPGVPDRTGCDPQIDTTCYKPLTSADSAAIRDALAYLRPLSSIPNATARQQCSDMRNAFNTLYANGKVFRGAYDTKPGDLGVGPHTGAYERSTSKMHIDPQYLNAAATGNAAALRELLDILLHESAHALFFDHPNGFTSTFWGLVYSDPYFNLLSPGTNTCLLW